MRTWGRFWGAIASSEGIGIVSSSGTPILPSGLVPGQQPAAGTAAAVWAEVETNSNGNNDLVYLTTLCQVLLLNLGESPFYATYGIPAQQAVMQGVFPDYYVQLTQKAFAPYFAYLTIVRTTTTNPLTYQVNVTTHSGVQLNASVPIPY